MKSKVFGTIASAAVVALALAGCGGGDAGGGEGGANGTIKVATVLTSAGPLADVAQSMRQGWDYAVEEINAAGGAGGYTFEMMNVDTDATPASSVRAATQAVSQDGAKVVMFQTSPENAAISTQLAGLDALNINTIAQDDGLRGASCAPNAFHLLASNSMLFNSVSDAMGKLEGDKWAIMAVDYSTGRGAGAAFAAAAQEHGKQIVSEQYAPLNTADYGSYITEIQSSGADGLFVVMYGADAEAFVNQASQYNLPEQLKTTLTMNVISEHSFDSLGDKILGDYLTKLYDSTADNPLNKAFVEGYEAKYGEKPDDYAANAYIGAQTLFAGVEKAQSDDTSAIRDALSGMTLDTIAGSITIRPEDHQANRDIYLMQVVEGANGLEFKNEGMTAGNDALPAVSPECKM